MLSPLSSTPSAYSTTMKTVVAPLQPTTPQITTQEPALSHRSAVTSPTTTRAKTSSTRMSSHSATSSHFRKSRILTWVAGCLRMQWWVVSWREEKCRERASRSKMGSHHRITRMWMSSRRMSRDHSSSYSKCGRRMSSCMTLKMGVEGGEGITRCHELNCLICNVIIVCKAKKQHRIKLLNIKIAA
jgi:hypothetical protein